MLSTNALQLLRLLRRWSAGSIHKFSEETQLPIDAIQKAVSELSSESFLLAEDMRENCTFLNQMLEITESGRKYLEKLDGAIATFPEKGKS